MSILSDATHVKIEPVLEIEAFDNEAFEWSFIIYYAPPGQEKFEEVRDQHLQGEGVCYGARDPGVPAAAVGDTQADRYQLTTVLSG